MRKPLVRCAAVAAAAVLFASSLANAADPEFKDIVRAISDHYGTRPIRIPFFGLVNAFTFVARPAGTKHIDLAVFENLRGDRMDPAKIERVVGGGWKPFVRVHSNRSDETTLIYMRPDGNDTKMLITTIERNEATVIQLKLNPEALQRWLDQPRRSAWDRR